MTLTALAVETMRYSACSPRQIADFGMSRDLSDNPYYVMLEGATVPIRWTAPEVVTHRKYSTASDIWSYGCVLYEIWSLGTDPFDKYTISEV